MGVQVACDWCGRTLNEGRERAEMRVTIRRTGREPGIFNNDDELLTTRHFCVSSWPDREALDRMVIRRPNAEAYDSDSCFGRALATITGTETEPAAMGMEWRLVPTSESRQFRGSRSMLGTTPLSVLGLKIATQRTLEEHGIITAEHAADVRQRGGSVWGLGPRRMLELDKALLEHGFLDQLVEAAT